MSEPYSSFPDPWPSFPPPSVSQGSSQQRDQVSTKQPAPQSAPKHPEPFLPPLGEPFAAQSALSKKALEVDDLPTPSLAGLLFRWVVFLGVLIIAAMFVWNVFFDQESDFEERESSDVIIETPSSKILGPKGGEVRLYDRAAIFVPKGALDRDILISIEKIRQGNVTDLYHLKPDHLKFILPVTVSIPYDQEPYRLYTGKKETQLFSPNKVTIDRKKRLAITKLSEF